MLSSFDPLVFASITAGSFVLGYLGCTILQQEFGLRFRKERLPFMEPAGAIIGHDFTYCRHGAGFLSINQADSLTSPVGFPPIAQ
jgi:hypothetical protein